MYVIITNRNVIRSVDLAGAAEILSANRAPDDVSHR